MAPSRLGQAAFKGRIKGGKGLTLERIKDGLRGEENRSVNIPGKLPDVLGVEEVVVADRSSSGGWTAVVDSGRLYHWTATSDHNSPKSITSP